MSEESKQNFQDNAPLLQVRHLRKYFDVKKKNIFQKGKSLLYAVDDVSFSINRNETLSLVGESGCGKTTVGKTILGLYEPTGGEVIFDGVELYKLTKEEMRQERIKMQMVFQDPYSSLNPRMTIFESIADPIRIWKLMDGADLEKRVQRLMDMVGLPAMSANRYPGEFSGGQLQRACIARALALNPKLIVCDEPVSALDVSIQSQVLNLLDDLQKELGMSYLFISHGLPVVKHISDNVGVMYLGKLVETAPCDELFKAPLHPYTQALLSAIPKTDPREKRDRQILQGDLPSPINPPKGCRFCTRCPYAADKCREVAPEMKPVGPNHMVACHIVKEDTGGNV